MIPLRQAIVRAVLVSALAAAASPAFAFNEQANYDACILRTLSSSWNRNVVGLLRNSCDQLYRQWSMLTPTEQAYHSCLLQYLPGVQSSAAIGPILSACRRQSADSVHFD